MGGACSSTPADSKKYKKHPRLAKEFKTGQTFLRTLFRVEFQFYGELEEVWKVQDKSNYALYSLHERKKVELIGNRNHYNYIIRENRVSVDLSNPFILKVHFAFQIESALFTATDYIHSRLSCYVKNGYNFLDEELKYIAASMVLALEYLRSKNIMHRDLRPANISFTPEGKIKLGGFLFAREYNPTINNSLDCVGTFGYMAPEVIERKQHSTLADLYSLGIALYELATSKKLFRIMNTQDLLTQMATMKIKKQDLPSTCSGEFIDLLNMLLIYNQKKRIGHCSFDEIKSHAWFRGFDWEALADEKMKPICVPKNEERDVYKEEKKKMDIKPLRRSSIQSLFVGYQYGVDRASTVASKDFDELI